MPRRNRRKQVAQCVKQARKVKTGGFWHGVADGFDMVDAMNAATKKYGR